MLPAARTAREQISSESGTMLGLHSGAMNTDLFIHSFDTHWSQSVLNDRSLLASLLSLLFV